MSTRDLIDAIATGDSVAIQTSFDSLMSAKVADRLDTMQQSVAQSMFRNATASEAVEQPTVEIEVAAPAETQGEPG